MTGIIKEELIRMRPMFYDMADDNCPDCGAVPAIMWRGGGAFQQRTECICGRTTRWVHCGHDARASASDDAALCIKRTKHFLRLTA